MDKDFDAAPFTVDTSDPDEKLPIDHSRDSYYGDRFIATQTKETRMSSAARKRLTAETLASRGNLQGAVKAYRLATKLFGRFASAATDLELEEVGRRLQAGLGRRGVSQLHDRIVKIASDLGEAPFPEEQEAEDDFPLDGQQAVDFRDNAATSTIQENPQDRSVLRALVKEGEETHSPTAGTRKPKGSRKTTAAALPREETETEVKEPDEVEEEDDDHVDEEDSPEGNEDFDDEGEDEEDEDFDDDEDDYEDEDEDFDDEGDDEEGDFEDDEDEDFDDEGDEDDEDEDDDETSVGTIEHSEDLHQQGGLDGVLTGKPTAGKPRRARGRAPKSEFRPNRWRYASGGEQKDEWAGFLSEDIPDLPPEYQPGGRF